MTRENGLYSCCRYDPREQLTDTRSLTCFVNQTHRLTQKYQVDLDYHAATFYRPPLMCPMSAILYTSLGCRRKVSSVRTEIHLIVPDHLGGVLAKSSENACVGDLATKFVSTTSTLSLQDIRTCTVRQKYCITL